MVCDADEGDLKHDRLLKSTGIVARVQRGFIFVRPGCSPESGSKSYCSGKESSDDSLLKKIHEKDFVKQDMWQAQVHSMICQKADVYFHSRNPSDEQIKRAFLKPCSRVEDTIEELLHKYGRDASICVLPEGPQTIPYISGQPCAR